MQALIRYRKGIACLASVGSLIVGLGATSAAAVPSFAVQTGQSCNACHVGGFGPQLIPFGRYRSPGAGFLTHAGSDPFSPRSIAGIAPYARVAYQKNYGDHNFELGAFGMDTHIHPGRVDSGGSTDHYTDLGVDGSFQLSGARKDVFTINGRYSYERQRLDGSRALGQGNLQDLRVDASYYWRNQIGVTLGGFNTWGSGDDLLYAANRTLRPDSSGLSLQIDGTPFGAGGSPLGPRFNMRVGIQFIDYLRFNGAAADYDGLSHNAGDNNAVRVFTWVAY